MYQSCEKGEREKHKKKKIGVEKSLEKEREMEKK